MNLKKILAASAISLSMVAGVGAAIGVSAGANLKEAEVKADATSTTVYLVVDETSLTTKYSIEDFRVYLNVNYKGDGDDWSGEGGPYDTFRMADTGKTHDSLPIYTLTFTDKYSGLGAMQFQIYDGTTWKEEFQPFGKKEWTLPSVYNGKMIVYGVNSWLTYADDSMTIYDVSMFAVVDGVNEGSIGSDTADAATIYNPEDPAFKANYSFDGWFNDEACTDPYVAAKPADDLELYAKYSHLDETAADTLYVVTGYGTSWSGRYIYTYSSTDSEKSSKKGFGVWPGTPINEAYLGITTAANFGGGNDVFWNGGIMKFACYNTFGADKVIIHDNAGNEAKADIVDGAAYFVAADLTSATVEEDTGRAAAVVYQYDEEFGATDPHCSTDPLVAAKLYNAYYDASLVDPNVKSWMDDSVVTTSNISVGDFASAMKTIVQKANENGGEYDLHGSYATSSQELQSSTNLALIAAIVAGSLVTAVGATFLLRRRKEDR